MGHHGHEDEMERFYTERDRERLPEIEERLRSAVLLITAIASSDLTKRLAKTCDEWLEANGYACKATRRRERERRSEELDREIERLRAEREALKSETPPEEGSRKTSQGHFDPWICPK